MARLLLGLLAVWVALRVLARRLFRGPLRPGWGLRFEVVVEVMREVMRRAGGVDEPEGQPSSDPFRRAVNPVPKALRARVALDKRELAGLYTEVLTPQGWSQGGAVLFYLHGGGYRTGSPRSHRALLARIAEAGRLRTVAVDYSKAPEHPFPAGLEDAHRAYRALQAEGQDPARLGIGGDSAGGGLSLALLQRLRAGGEQLPVAAVLLSPWVDLRSDGPSLRANRPYDYLQPELIPRVARSYAGDHPLEDPLISPVHAELAGLPPMLIQTGGAEIFLSENEQLFERARAAGVDVEHQVEPAMIHVYQAFADLDRRGSEAIGRLGAFLSARLSA